MGLAVNSEYFIFAVPSSSHFSSTSVWGNLAPAWVLHRLQLPSGHIQLLPWVIFHGPQGGSLLHCCSPCAAGAQLPSPWDTGDSLLWCMEHLLPLLLCWCWCLQSCYSHVLTLLSYVVLHSFFFSISWACCHRGVTNTADGLSFGLSLSCLDLALSDIGATSDVLSQKPHLQPPDYENLVMQTQTSFPLASPGVLIFCSQTILLS